jgi:hypothetical protein
MKKKLLLLAVALAGLALIGVAQDTEGLSFQGGKLDLQQAATDPPVTQAEAAEVLERTSSVILLVTSRNRKESVVAPSFAASREPASREQILRFLNELYSLIEPDFKFTPRRVTVRPERITIPRESPVRQSLERMIEFGFVAPFGPLASSEKPTLSLTEFGDAIGLFLARAADLTHTPDPKWSPYMSDGG